MTETKLQIIARSLLALAAWCALMPVLLALMLASTVQERLRHILAIGLIALILPIAWFASAEQTITTNLVVSGTGLNPEVSGVYTSLYADTTNTWYGTNGYYVVWDAFANWWICTNPSLFYANFFSDQSSVTGTYTADIEWGTGTPVAVYSYVTSNFPPYAIILSGSGIGNLGGTGVGNIRGTVK